MAKTASGLPFGRGQQNRDIEEAFPGEGGAGAEIARGGTRGVGPSGCFCARPRSQDVVSLQEPQNLCVLCLGPDQ